MATSMVTGGTSGIGREFVTQLASRGDDIVIVARDTTRMAQIKEQIEARYGVSVETIQADLSNRHAVASVAERLEDPDSPIDLLVNDAGFAVHAKILDPDSLELQNRAFEVMCRAVLELSAAAGRAMVARGHGAILNVSSVTALTAMGTYAAHKAWVRTFTEGLVSELRGTGVTATVVNPGLTRTEFHERAGMDETAWPDLAWLRAEDVASAALDAVRRGQVICTPSVRYRAANAALRAAPRWFVRRVAGHGSMRARYSRGAEE